MREERDLTALLEHAPWVRALATRLARGDADDASQELWLAALRAPPDPSRPARPWLARVLANAAKKRFRDAETRGRHEAASGNPDDVVTPEAAVARAEVHRLLVDAVLALDEPFRQTVLLKFFDGLTSPEVAARLGVPEGTVRWRLKEATDRLRVTLDRQHGGRRETWLLAVAPLLLPPAGPWLSTGLALMNKKTQAVIVATLVLVASVLVGWRMTPGAPAGEAPRPVATPAVAANPTINSSHSVTPAPGMSADSGRIDGSTPIVLPVGAPTPRGPGDVLGSVLPLPLPPTTAGVSPGDAGVRFALDREGIRAAMRSAMPQAKECYEAWLALQPGTRGNLVIGLVIDTDDGVEGRITKLAPVDAGTGLGNVTLEGCVLASFADLRFEPPLNGPVNVTYPLRFDTDGGSR